MSWRLVVAALALPLCATAQGPTGIVLEPGDAVANQPVKVVIDFATAQPWCGLRVDFGDGDISDVLVEEFPLTIVRRYAAPGRYVLRAEGRLLLRGMASSPPCAGARRTATITVAESARDAQPSRGRTSDRRTSDKRDDESEDGDDRRPARPDRQGRNDRPEREDRNDRDRSAQDPRQERRSRDRDADTAPVRAPTPVATPPARDPKAGPEPARAPAPRTKPARDDTLKVF